MAGSGSKIGHTSAMKLTPINDCRSSDLIRFKAKGQASENGRTVNKEKQLFLTKCAAFINRKVAILIKPQIYLLNLEKCVVNTQTKANRH